MTKQNENQSRSLQEKISNRAKVLTLDFGDSNKHVDEWLGLVSEAIDDSKGKLEKKQRSFSKYGEVPEVKSALEDTSGTQAEIADKTGVDPSTISRWRHGVRTPSLENAIDFAGEVGADIEDLFARSASHKKAKKPGKASRPTPA